MMAQRGSLAVSVLVALVVIVLGLVVSLVSGEPEPFVGGLIGAPIGVGLLALFDRWTR